MLQLLAAIAGEACQQRRRGDQISSIPLISRAALFDDIDVVANLQGEIVLFTRSEGSSSNSKRDLAGW